MAGAYKLVVDSMDLQPLLLFNLEEDPFEMHNLVALTAFGDVVDALTTQLCKWRDEI